MRIATRLLVMLAAVGCTDLTTPTRSVSSTFVLRSIDGQPLPVLTLESPTFRLYAAADTIVLYDNGDYAENSVTRVDRTQPPSVELQAGRSEGTYSFRDDSIDFAFRCPPGALCIRPPLAWRPPEGGLTTAYRTTSGLIEVKHYEQVGFPPD